ncbi:hypothetical protein CHLRE_03g154350v5 [Chlamydomonas reinhardtii]|uniref:Cytochrome c oxidase polypeptide II n=1 Tax=Chlamydomonas reinhardtii TaxID=3055 RepID=Q9AU05_CHLRE|nr:uncharacterized protein CHLRE_03g154350v5 [Chlamydomonas reinhardtii]AAK30367.1 cytochrome c oxidase subunit II [Chlamydomonas reinhardtii]AAL37900.1 cytochrome c oxidase subunit II [Chlamydomonas reinhardtii]PNW84680.1 hypothetical protein CHLRE_03g154350v5 [Chlamydomonas reinhardtii]|eukprot:XP_001697546.1 cytochrome c oxidase subunit II, protein IIa of split subunit [Chlamydomonas reinhardtii]
MLRQSGLSANKLFCSNLLQSQQKEGNKLVWNAMLFSSKAEGSAVQQVVASEGVAQAVPQFSSEAAAALAAKRRGLIGSGMSLAPSKPFAARGLTSAAKPAAAAAAGAAEAAQPADKYAGLKKVLKAAAALAAALGLTTTTAAADSPQPWQLLFQDTATSTAQAMIDLHHDIFFFLITVVTLVFYMMFQIITKFHYSKVLKPEKLTHHTTMEVIWTIIPTLIVVMIAIPSLTLIYSLDQHTERPGLTVKIIGRQWYWSYEMHDHLQHKLLDPDRLVGIAEKALVK